MGGSRLAILLGIIFSLSNPKSIIPVADANHAPADKIGVSASTVEVLSTPLFAGSSSQEVTLLRGTLKTSSPTDLSLSVHAECGLWTDVQILGGGASNSKAAVNVWVEVDGSPVPVSQQSGDDGKIVFCNRDLSLSATLPFLDLFQKSRSANAFQWMALNVGSGFHTVVVKARLDAHVTGVGMAQAGVGRRTLIVEPQKLANDATF
jgi:hypothetical protein